MLCKLTQGTRFQRDWQKAILLTKIKIQIKISLISYGHQYILVVLVGVGAIYS